MAFCSQCGTAVNDGASFCTACGAKLGAAGEQQYSSRQSAASQPTDNSKTMAILAVIIPVLFFLPLVVDPKTAFGTFWSNQSLLLLLAYVVSGLLCFIFIGYILYVAVFVFWIMAIVSVCKGEMKPIPLIGEIEIIK
jgi:uncharacterized membrane protein